MHARILPQHGQSEWAPGSLLIGRVPESPLHLGQAALALSPQPSPFLTVLAARPPTAAAVCLFVCGFSYSSSHLSEACKHKQTKHKVLSYRVIKHTNIDR